MSELVDAVTNAVASALAAIECAESVRALREVRSEHVGEHSPLAQLSASLRSVPPEDRAAAGKAVGGGRKSVLERLESREKDLARAEEEQKVLDEAVDVTAYASRWSPGGRHPLSLLEDEVCDIFAALGWDIAEGPELEHEWFNFDALNFDADHPARAMQDTFFVDPQSSHLVLRTHTSPVQVRLLLEHDLPLYALAPGRVYRTDELDATHTPVFTQFEGIAVDRGLTMAHLRGILEYFARAMFGADARIRLRPSFFPFTEPSAELDVWHPTFPGGARWIEWGGCGMINPNVLHASGIDADEYQGFAFGMGVERTLMFRNGIADMRDIVEGDMRFTTQFGMVV